MSLKENIWIKTVLQHILADALEYIPVAQAGSVFLFNNNYFEMVAAIGYPLEKFRGIKLHYTKLNVSLHLDYDKDTTESVHIFTNIAEKYTKTIDETEKVFKKYGRTDDLKSVLALSLYRDNKIFALMTLDNFESKNAYDEKYIPIARVFSEQVSNYLNIMDKLQYSRKTNNNYEFLLGLIAHELKNITQGLNLVLQLLTNKITNKTASNVDTLFQNMKELLERQNVISYQSQIILKSGKERESLYEMDLVIIIKEWLELSRKLKPKVNIKFKTKIKNGNIKANLLIKEVFNNLLSNSIKYNNEDRPLTIEISLQRYKPLEKTPNTFIKTPNYFVLKYSDNGIGMTDNEKKILFKPFTRGKDNKGVPGLGLGLTIVKNIIENYNGFIWAEDTILGKPDQGISFILGFPIFERT